MRASLCLTAGVFIAGCSGERSIALVFPNEAARMATERITVDVRTIGGESDLDCAAMLGNAREGKVPPGTGTIDSFDYPFMPDAELANVESGKSAIYVLAFADPRDEDAPAILEGCTDDFDSEGAADEHTDVRVELEVVIPEGARLVKVRGDRTVGREDEALDVELEVRVDANAPRGGAIYAIPGVEVSFAAEDGFTPAGSDSVSAPDGTARAIVSLPRRAQLGKVTVEAPQLDTAAVEFTLSVVAKSKLQPNATITSRGTPIALAFGHLTGGPGLDLAILSCEGSREGCTPGRGLRSAPGRTILTAIADAGGSRTQLTAPAGLGVIPTALAIADVLPDAGGAKEEIAILDGRREECQARACEGSEALVLREHGGQLVLEARETLTASNGVGLAAYVAAGDARPNLAIVAQGKTPSGRACSRIDPCVALDSATCMMSPELCGCPRGEYCECSSGAECSCLGDDQLIDILQLRTDGLFNRNGCQELDPIACSMSGTSCCGDSFRGNRCDISDACGCNVPNRTYTGAYHATTLPLGITTGPLRGASWDAVVAAEGGFGLADAKPSERSFVWNGQPFTNARATAAVIAGLDTVTDAALDLAFISPGPCTTGPSSENACPIFRAIEETPLGCLGVYYTSGQDSVFDVQFPMRGGCRRHQLPFEPSGVCAGRFNDDDAIDLAIASSDLAKLAIFSGDGRGGLLDPPELVELPAGAQNGGPIACGDVDGDGFDDVAVGDPGSGFVHLSSTRR